MNSKTKTGLAFLAIAAILASPAVAQRTGGAGAMNDHRAPPGSGSFRPEDARDPYNRGIAAFDSGDFPLAQKDVRGSDEGCALMIRCSWFCSACRCRGPRISPARGGISNTP